MTEPGKYEEPERSSERDGRAEEQETRPSLNQDIRARITRPHKGDVGRAGTNEEIFQGSKEKELR